MSIRGRNSRTLLDWECPFSDIGRITEMDKIFEDRKKMVYRFMQDDLYIPMKQKEIAAVLQVPRENKEELKEVLKALEMEGKITVSKRGKYSVSKEKHLTGLFRANQKGFGFVTAEGEASDIYIGADQTAGAMDGDRVEIILLKAEGRGHREGKVIRILDRGVKKVVGLYQVSAGKKYGFVLPDHPKVFQDIFIPQERSMNAVDGHKVVAELTSYGDQKKKPEGRIVEIIGHVNDPGTDIMSIVKGFDLPVEFSEKVLNQAVRVAKPVSDADMSGRKDLRDWQMVTIDGEDAKDLDDAVSVVMEGEDYLLGVHIADVTNYVQENSALDREAYERGTSVYLVDRVIPMLPHTLSNGICSLNAGEDRLALSCIMRINPSGRVIDHEIAETVIHVDQRMTYTSVNKILEDEDAGEMEKYQELVPMFQRMGELSLLIRRRRHQRGSIDFDFPETKMILDEKGKPLELKPYERNTATRLIEDFMLLANETVAEDYYWQEVPFLYRTHEAPDEEKIRALATFINNFGYSMHIGVNEVRPKEIQKLLAKVEGTLEEPLISRLALRSMKQARYTAENTGHFGLAAKYYTHFTSPIRRYPDLQIHRIIKDHLRGRLNQKKMEHYQSILPEVAKHSSEMERRADEAERETVKLKKAEYMKERLGHVYEGVISSITRWGMYVELPNTVEGLIHVVNMRDDRYEYDESRYEMAGIHTGKRYKLGQKIKVKVAGADCLQRTIDFEIWEEGDEEYGKEEWDETDRE